MSQSPHVQLIEQSSATAETQLYRLITPVGTFNVQSKGTELVLVGPFSTRIGSVTEVRHTAGESAATLRVSQT